MDFYPRSPRGERPVSVKNVNAQTIISIHAPREGSDDFVVGQLGRDEGISIHAPREGSDVAQQIAHFLVDVISIHAPREGSDALLSQRLEGGIYFYPRSPRGERLGRLCPDCRSRHISIHAPREGSDLPI